MPHLLIPTLLALLAGCTTMEEDREIPLTDVPPDVMAAARDALPGAEFTAAEIEQENGEPIYELEAERDGEEWEVEVAADGTVLEVEKD